MWRTALALLGETPGTASEVRDAEQMATLPMRMGGLGLRSAGRCATAAYWASWADALPMINQRNSSIADMVVARLSADGPQDDALLDFMRLRADWRGKAFGGSQVGQIFRVE